MGVIVQTLYILSSQKVFILKDSMNATIKQKENLKIKDFCNTRKILLKNFPSIQQKLHIIAV